MMLVSSLFGQPLILEPSVPPTGLLSLPLQPTPTFSSQLSLVLLPLSLLPQYSHAYSDPLPASQVFTGFMGL